MNILKQADANTVEVAEAVNALIAKLGDTAPLRLRPILMTQATTILGLLPLAINWGEGGDMLQPMAVAVIGGLFFSLFVTLLLLPSLYFMFERSI